MIEGRTMADNGSMGANDSNMNGFPKSTQYEELHSALIQEKKDLENRLADIDQDLAFLIFAKLRNDWKTKAPTKQKKAARKKKAAKKKK